MTTYTTPPTPTLTPWNVSPTGGLWRPYRGGIVYCGQENCGSQLYVSMTFCGPFLVLGSGTTPEDAFADMVTEYEREQGE